MNAIAQAAKAVLASIAAGLSALGAVLIGGATFSEVTDAQWVTIALAVVTTFSGVYHISNRPPSA